jgi:hypothetical protein
LSWQHIWNAVSALSPGAVRDLANYFASIPPKPALAARGRQIVMDGIPGDGALADI